MAAFVRNKRNRKLNPYKNVEHARATFALAAEAANMIAVTVQLKDEVDKNVAAVSIFNWFIASDAAGTTPAAALSGGVAAGASGKVHQTTAGIAGFATTTAAGVVVMNLTDTVAKTVYLVVVHPNGVRTVSQAIVFA